MTRTLLILAAAGGSLALLLAAFGFQYLGEMPPCKLCIWQRYSHAGAVLAGGVALATGLAALAWLGALAALSSAGLGLYHTGVERGWWDGPSSCTSGDVSGLSVDDLIARIEAAPLVRCDEVPWDLLGLSMASWNMLAALALTGLWVWAARAR